jgi:hypothetical protein
MWLMAAQLEIRRKDLKSMRQILGSAIGMAPKDKVCDTLINVKKLVLDEF